MPDRPAQWLQRLSSTARGGWPRAPMAPGGGRVMERHTKRIGTGLVAACLAPLAAVALVEPAPGEAPTVRELYEAARQRYAPIDSYVARLTRREVVKGKQEPEEVILLKFRER